MEDQFFFNGLTLYTPGQLPFPGVIPQHKLDSRKMGVGRDREREGEKERSMKLVMCRGRVDLKGLGKGGEYYQNALYGILKELIKPLFKHPVKRSPQLFSPTQ